jgi:hypothetical protein
LLLIWRIVENKSVPPSLPPVTATPFSHQIPVWVFSSQHFVQITPLLIYGIRRHFGDCRMLLAVS